MLGEATDRRRGAHSERIARVQTSERCGYTVVWRRSRQQPQQPKSGGRFSNGAALWTLSRREHSEAGAGRMHEVQVLAASPKGIGGYYATDGWAVGSISIGRAGQTARARGAYQLI